MSRRPPTPSAFGVLLRQWRGARGLSQLALAAEVQTTTRHLSYLENGRSRPGRDLVLRLGESLDLPLRARNELLTAAGLAAEFPQRELESRELAPYRRAMERMLERVDPFPAFVLDPLFRVRAANRAARSLMPALEGAEQPSLVDLFLAPGAARDSILNFAEVAWSWHARITRATARIETASATALRERVEAHLRDVPRPAPTGGGDPVVCPTFRLGETQVRTIGMTMRFGPSRDVTLEELFMDVLLPRDEEAERFFEALGRA